MRVTENTNFNTVRDTVHRSRSKMENLQTQASTQKKLNVPSDSPVGAAKILEVRTDKVISEQLYENGKLAEAFLNNSDHVLEELSDIVLRAKEIALGQSNGMNASEGSRLGVAEEIAQLYQQSIALANRRIGDRYLFAGFKVDRPPVTPEGNFVGDQGQMMVEIARDVFIAMNIPGIEAFNTRAESSTDTRELQEKSVNQPASFHTGRGPASVGAEGGEAPGLKNINLFNQLAELRISLLTGDTQGVRDTLENFDSLHSHLVATRSKVGSRIRGIQNTYQTLDRHSVTNAQLSSYIEDADMIQVMNDLAKEETAFRNALQSSQRLIQPKLMDFLK